MRPPHWTGNGEKKKQAGDEEEEKGPSRLSAVELEDEAGRSRAEDEVRLVSGGQQCRGTRCCITAVMCAAFLGLGTSVSILGPTFPDLAANVDSTVGDLSYIFVARSMGYLGGSILGGVLFGRINQFLLLGLSMLATCTGLFVLPWCKKAILLTGVMSVVGASMGFLDTGGNVVLLNTWGDDAGPHVQAIHFSFALGALLAPILAKLIPEILPFDILHKTLQEVQNMPLEVKKSMLSYVVIAAYILLVSMFLFILYRKSPPNRSAAKGSGEEERTAKYHNALIFLLCLFFFFYVGAEVAYGSFIFTYAITMAEMDHDKAAGLNSIFWGVFAAVRGFAICFATFLYPGTMLLLSAIGCTVSSVLLTIFYKEYIVLWIGSALYGASMATTFPSGLTWAQQYTTIGGASASLFVVGAALGEMAIPASVGYLQGMLPTLPILLYAIVACSAVTAVLFPVMYKLATSSQDKVQWHGVESEDRRALLLSSGLQKEEEEDVQKGNDADFEGVEINDRSKDSITVIPEDAPEGTSTSNSNSQTFSKNGTFGDQVVDQSPLTTSGPEDLAA